MHFKKLRLRISRLPWKRISVLTGISVFSLVVIFMFRQSNQNTLLLKNESELKKLLAKSQKNLSDLKSQDQYKINKSLEGEISNIQKTYKKAVNVFEALNDLSLASKNTSELDKLFASSLSMLSDKNYASAEATLAGLEEKIKQEKEKIAIQSVASMNLDVLDSNNSAPASGYSRQKVNANGGSYAVDIVAGDLSSTRVIVDTASDSDCRDNCPVMALSDYVSRSGAYAGVNGSYFCPASYPSCAGKTNSFDTLLMNKNKHYFNSDNNVYSTVPAVIFGGGWVRFVGKSLEWGRDTGVDGVIANQPFLVSGGKSMFSGNDDPKMSSKGSRAFVSNKGNTVYIGVVHNVSVSESALVLQALGMDNAINLDSGGSIALWSGGYKVGPGRNIPNAILFVRK